MKLTLKHIVGAMALVIGMGSCDYLNIVPDNTIKLETMFETQEQAYGALATCYEYMPNWGWLNNSMNLAGDEFIVRLDGGESGHRDRMPGEKLMKGWNSAQDPYLCYWNGNKNAASLYVGIRYCNLFLENIHLVKDITDEDRKDWIAQVKILKAYYHYYLTRLYGPICIVDKNQTPSTSPSDVRLKRQPVDVCFKYAVDLIDEVLYDQNGNEKADLKDSRPNEFLGMVDRTIAKAIKAEVLLTQASPLFNGNTEYYSNFKNVDGELFFPMQKDNEKWKRALDAAKIAIDAAHARNKKLYEYDAQGGANIQFYDKDVWGKSEIVEYCYNNRYSIVDPWNSELIWGYSNVGGFDQGTFQHASQCRRTDNQSISEYSWQWLCASYRMGELYYTRNGVPINEDQTFDYANRLDIVTIPNDTYHLGYMQPNEKTVKLYLNREPRFYSWIAVDNSYWRNHQTKLEMHMKYDQFPGGRYSTKQDDFYWSGIAIKKLVHPESLNEYAVRMVRYPNPIIRLADLYLMYAEAYNEYYGPEDGKAYFYLNEVRKRAGLPKVETVWSNAAIVKNVNKHQTQEGLREIIQTERLIELSFEGHRYFDLCRWKRAGEFFVSSVKGWNARSGRTYEDFYQVTELQPRVWETPKNYLFPIPLDDINKNPNLVQNPGW